MNYAIQSHVWHDKQCFFVSTIRRESSAQDGPREFLETIVWEYDETVCHCGRQLYVREGPSQCIHIHLSVCEELFYKGKLENEE